MSIPTTTSPVLAQARARAAMTPADERAHLAALRAASQQAEAAAREATAALSHAERYSTWTLTQVVEEGTAGPGRIREARVLLTVDGIARRQRVVGIAHTGQNLGLWGRWSEAVHYAAQDLAAMIRNGREDEEHYTERTARLAREVQTAHNEAEMAAAVAAVHNR